jgi:hypothetical protein
MTFGGGGGLSNAVKVGSSFSSEVLKKKDVNKETIHPGNTELDFSVHVRFVAVQGML